MTKVPVTHQHIFNIIRTFIEERDLERIDPIRVLDIGCGDGRLIGSLHRLFRKHFPELDVEIHGFDVEEMGYKAADQIGNTVDYLKSIDPAIEWGERIRMISAPSDWGYEKGYFDIAVSNQVVEHVEDLAGFLVQLKFALKASGKSIHLFPLRNCIQEAHCKVPFSHWIRDFHLRASWIALLSRAGIGRYRRDKQILGHGSYAVHAEETAKFIECGCTYRTFKQISDMASDLKLAASYSFTKDFFLTRIGQMFPIFARRRYVRWNWLGLESLAFYVCRYLSSSTIIIWPLQYDVGARIAAEKRFAREQLSLPVREEAKVDA